MAQSFRDAVYEWRRISKPIHEISSPAEKVVQHEVWYQSRAIVSSGCLDLEVVSKKEDEERQAALSDIVNQPDQR